MKLNENRSYKIIIISILTVFIVILLFSLLINPILNVIVKPNLLSKINSGNLIVTIDEVTYSLFSNTVRLSSIEVHHTAETNNDTLHLDIKSITAGVHWMHLLFNEGYKFSTVDIEQPVIGIISSNSRNQQENNSKEGIFNFIDSLSNQLHLISADVLRAEGGYFTSKNISSGLTDSVINFSFKIDSLLFDSLSIQNPKLKAAADMELNADEVKLFFENSRYMLSFSELSVSSYDRNLFLSDLILKPFLKDENFFAAHQYRTDRFILNLENAEAAGINFRDLFQSEKLTVENITLDNFLFEALTNMRMPENPNALPPVMPNEAVNEIPFQLNVDKLELKEGRILVKELYPYSDEAAELQFNDLYTTAVNIRNGEAAKLDVLTKLAGSGKLQVHFDLVLNPEKLNLIYYGSLDTMNAADLNNFITIADRVKVTSGIIHKIEFDITVNGDSAIAQSTPVYSDLSIEELDDESGSSSGLKEIFTSFIANTFVIKKNNSGAEPEIEKSRIIYRKQQKDAFFEYIWIALRKALGEIVGFD